ncbi:MAG TPA: elongation factor G [Candidatus Marinimicrobia bacterium]|mgnify:FL=1|nr:elongation factor G [Candidatus Neomarinimicrobiota bacterium]HRS51327.1 elongation factor G [Candidatus Neomarinimicrobiota bacterium]HRU91435.1 elongation factor G [Candidatus Neomarinimicrobiota bacterium]
MKEYQTEEIRNIVLLGHGSSGKTSLSEAMLYSAGVTTRLGRVDEGTTVSDYHDDEIERKFSISSSLLNCEWNKVKFNILDAPGYLDFVGEAKALTRVADLALMTINGQSGVEVGTELVSKFAQEDELPVWFIINMLDKEHADFQKSLNSIHSSFTKKAVQMQIPVNSGPNFDTIADVVTQKVIQYKNDQKGTYTESEPIGEIKEKLFALKNELIESVAESDDALLEKYLGEGAISEEEFINGLRKAIIKRELFPVFVASGLNNIGITKIMDHIVNFAPNPSAKVSVSGSYKGNSITRKISDSEPTSLFIFKTVSEMHVGELSIFKVISGSLKSGVDLLNSNNGKIERIGQIYCINGKEKQEVAHLHAGDIGAVVKLKFSRTTDTLCDQRAPIIYPEISFPEPVIQVAIEPKSRGDEEKISAGLQALTNEDPTMSWHFDPELKQTILSGQGELHLAIILQRLKQKFGVEVNQLSPRIPYRETIRKRGDSKYRHKKQTGGAGQFAEVWMYVEPGPPGSGVEFTNTLVGQNVDRVFVPSVEKGVRSACEEGILAGYRVTDVKAVFYDGKMHPVDSKDIAFQIAGKGAFKECFMNGNPVLLEPIYNLEVIVPEEYMGDVMGDISVRRGKIQGVDSEGPFQKITAKVPLAELYRYSTALRSMTQGRGMHRQSFSHYEQMPKEIQDKVVAASKKDHEE